MQLFQICNITLINYALIYNYLLCHAAIFFLLISKWSDEEKLKNEFSKKQGIVFSANYQRTATYAISGDKKVHF